MIQFFMPMIPPTVTAQEKDIGRNRKTGKAYLHDTPEILNAKKKLIANLWQHRPEKPYACGVRLIVKWCFPRGKHKNGEYKTTKPDTDNLEKILKDCMTRCGFWTDDALVASETAEKFWAEIPGIWILIDEKMEMQSIIEPETRQVERRYNGVCHYCPDCHTMVDTWDKFCRHCGVKFEGCDDR